MKGYYKEHTSELQQELKTALPSLTRRQLHRKTPWRHFVIALRQVALLVLLPLIIFRYPSLWAWLPSSILLGFTVFSFSVLLHEVLHNSVFNRKRPGLSYVLGFFYGMVSGLSSSQFTRWHLDHHDELGSATLDPKRFYLSPKKNSRLLKFLYFTPVLFPIYFRAAALGQKNYEPELKHRIMLERILVIFIHLACLIYSWSIDPFFCFKVYILPVFFVFPVAFAINRLGQHYIINPEDPANWSTLVRPNWIWNTLFLFSSYHLEHHYFPSVPFYHLPALQKALLPFFKARNIRSFGYTELLKIWLIDNHPPHSAL